ncbi:Ada metal-binding domain-containing protein [Streptomyces sp. LHD-70]|uniref:Ada metal-binding domain-containing protein n=1 Tax=Streptomyces sp. LHD-70 TaxID=3072140 RepID=UPI00280D9778|nr:Ada metal-binding domain-containing protein [Streptomyces sp. LHD-70]MDQ8706884.1 Ada metal-binding domain-containing protein [Streptomyces sp. LHD-70]
MNRRGKDTAPSPEQRPGSVLPGLVPPPPQDFALRVLQRVGIPRERYDTYVRLDVPAGGLFVAATAQAVTGAALDGAGLTATGFEELHHARTGRSAIPAAKPFPGLTTALRTGRAARLPIDLSGLDAADRTVLEAVRTVPAGQLRPVSWIAREAGLTGPDVREAGLTGPDVPEGGLTGPDVWEAVVGALARNPVVVLVPCHRVTYDNGVPCDAAQLPDAGAALRAAEGIDMGRVDELLDRGAVFLGSDTTRIYCHPTCAHARRITRPHQVPFGTARDARRAGYRACKSCRPVAA